MNKNAMMAIVVVLVVLVGGYGGYRLYKHYTRPTAVQPVAQTTTAPTTASSAPANSVYKMSQSSKFGSYLSDSKGMTLYTYAKDKTGVSNCTGACLTAWPAFVAPSASGTFPADITVITRPDKSLQYAWKGMPLYYYQGDKAAGDTNGDGIGGVWSIAK